MPQRNRHAKADYRMASVFPFVFVDFLVTRMYCPPCIFSSVVIIIHVSCGYNETDTPGQATGWHGLDCLILCSLSKSVMDDLCSFSVA
jgi:hypothetical protein